MAKPTSWVLKKEVETKIIGIIKNLKNLRFKDTFLVFFDIGIVEN